MNENRRNNYIQIRLNEEEKTYLEEKFKASRCKSKSDFVRHMVLEGIILHFDADREKNLMVSVNRIAANINQIARRVNATGTIYDEDISCIKEGVDEIRQQLKYFLSLLRKLKP